MGKISADKTRYALTIEKDLKEKLEHEAKEQNRSLNNLIETILKGYISNK
ncbi:MULTISPECIES: DNA-binding protein [Bacillus cereus group]|uniref:DNA-binding protein n=1 Tax=Bacillus cereus TaxID=1396 RepID=A0AB34DDF3_BACCE|nr:MULTISPECIES: DNA-binding protein [Bacillus cereus group]KAB2500816.1 DNA-binding protein [Bacillus cereus]PDZ92566.1 DNA-binding protein [Bacillus thuringiensis]PFA84001.1 DNA-binding protein [Bacillus thuringiensis]